MIDRSDIQARLRLFRYGLIVIVVVAFVTSLLAPAIYLNAMSSNNFAVPPLSDFLGTALLFTIVVAVIAVAAYFGYRAFLTRGNSQ